MSKINALFLLFAVIVVLTGCSESTPPKMSEQEVKSMAEQHMKKRMGAAAGAPVAGGEQKPSAQQGAQ